MMHDDDHVGVILKDAASAFQAPAGLMETVRDGLAAGSEPRHRRPSRRRMIVAALATVSGAAAMLAVVIWPTSVTMADMVAALDDAPWVHIRYDTGREVWISVPKRVYATKTATGHHVYSDYTELRQWRWSIRYDLPDTQITERTLRKFPWHETIWEHTVGYLEQQAKEPQPRRIPWSVEVAEETIDDRTLVRFDSFHTDGLGRRLLLKQVWADRATRLPWKIREKLQLAHRDELGVTHENGVFEFPESGPESIYDLGVPRDMPIVKRSKKGPTPEAKTVLDAARAARERFPEHFRQLTWGVDVNDYVSVHHFSGRPNWRDFGDLGYQLPWFDTARMRIERYWQADEELPRAATAGQVEAWLPHQTSSGLSVSDGHRMFTRMGPFTSRPLEARVMVQKRRTLFSFNDWILELQWPLYEQVTASFDVFEPGDGAPAGTIGLRAEVGDTRSDYYLDPDLDFICVKRTRSRLVDGAWETEAFWQLADFVQLPDGQWVATSSVDPEGRVTRHFAFTVLEEQDVSDELFDIDALVEQARAEGAIIETH